MKKIAIIFILIISNLYSQNELGKLLIIGGGKRPPAVMKKFIEVSGGENSDILIIPMASGDPVGTAEYQKKQLLEFGASKVSYIICNHEQADTDSLLNSLKGITGIFISGGDQNRLTDIFLKTKFLKEVKQFYRDGGIIAGTSAGAAIMSKVMITGDEKKNNDPKRAFETIEMDNIITTEGFGFLNNCIIDQHFIIRRRHNRLISSVLENPELVGIGIDESTAILVLDGNLIEVLGDSQVIIYDARNVKQVESNSNGKISALKILTNVLTVGNKYYIKESENCK